jgi:hypothetical protein
MSINMFVMLLCWIIMVNINVFTWYVMGGLGWAKRGPVKVVDSGESGGCLGVNIFLLNKSAMFILCTSLSR